MGPLGRRNEGLLVPKIDSDVVYSNSHCPEHRYNKMPMTASANATHVSAHVCTNQCQHPPLTKSEASGFLVGFRRSSLLANCSTRALSASLASKPRFRGPIASNSCTARVQHVARFRNSLAQKWQPRSSASPRAAPALEALCAVLSKGQWTSRFWGIRARKAGATARAATRSPPAWCLPPCWSWRLPTQRSPLVLMGLALCCRAGQLAICERQPAAA
jgi:hypothetical protein